MFARLIERIQNVRSVIRKNSRYNIFLSLLALNLLGIVCNIFYFSIVNQQLMLRVVYQLAFVLGWAVPLAFYLYIRRERIFTKVIGLVKSNQKVDAIDLLQAKHTLRTRPLFVSLMNGSIWLLAGIQQGLVLYFIADEALPRTLHMVFVIIFLSNPIISLLCYFLTEVLSRNDMRVVEIDIDMRTIAFSIRNKVLFTMLFVSILFMIMVAAFSIAKNREFAMEMMRDTRFILQISGVLAICIVYCAAAAFLLSQTVTLAVRDLVTAMDSVKEGKFDIKVDITSTDEVAVLSKGFNSMTMGLSERERMRHLFGSYVSAEIRDEILEGNLELGGQRTECTILFADIRDFTSMSEQNDPEMVVGLLNHYFTEMVRAISAHGGVIDKFIGDAIMAIFGAPKPLADHAKHALDAAGEMLQRLAAMNELQRMKGEVELKIGIGIHTGSVVIGNIGSENRKQFTVIGDAVNIASRLESLTKEFKREILFSENTFEKTGRGILIGDALLKGKSASQKVFGFG